MKKLITNKLNPNNRIEILVGEGWYRGVFRAGATDQSRHNYGDIAGLLAELVIEYEGKDRAEKRIVTDTNWLCAESAIR